MLNRLSTTWDTIRTSLWLIPSAMIAAGMALAVLMLRVDAGHGAEDQVRWWINSGDGEDARNLLSTLLTSMITMASMAFSVTVVALTLAANSYGPRLIRIFRADLRTQSVLGLFAMTIVYCLVVLRSTHGKAPAPEVPHASVTVGTVLGLLSVLALLAFIQGVARLIVADEVVNRVRREAEGAVDDLPLLEHGRSEGGAGDRPASERHAADEEEQGDGSNDLPSDFDERSGPITLPREGYVQAVDYDGVVAWAIENEALVRLEFRAGDFVVDGDRRVRVYPAPADPERVRAEIDAFIVSGNERTPTQDLEFAIRHLVEVAVRALSPGINDPFTATVVVDRLRATLSRLMGRRLPSQVLRDDAGRVRVSREVSSFEGVLDAAFHQIRQAGSTHPAVLIHMLEALARMAEHVRLGRQRRALAHHAALLRDAAEREVHDPSDREDVERSYRRAVAALERTGADRRAARP